MFDPEFQRKALSLVMGFIMQFSETPAEPEVQELSVNDLNVSTISVSCLKVAWDGEPDRDYYLSCTAHDDDYAYADNMYFAASADGKTETVEVIYEFPYEDGWTDCFAGERASGLRVSPASDAIYGSIVDPITDTGIRRDEYGDYCAALGLFYGLDGDRYCIELENGTQFTVKQCDSKGWADDGEGKYHNFGGSGKCIVEFIYDDYNLPSCVAFSVLTSEQTSNQSRRSTTANP